MSCAKTELCIFDTAMPQVVVDNACFEEIFPVNTITGKNETDVEFNIIGSNTDYLDLNDTLLYVELKVQSVDKGELKDLAAAADVTPTNFMFHTLFKDALLSFNNEKIEGGNNVYAHKAMLDTIINYGSDTKDTNLTSIGYDSDDADRKAWIAESKTFSMCGSLQLDFFDQPKYLLPGVNVHLRLQRNKSSFCLKAPTGTDLKLLLLEARLYVRRVKVEQSVLMGHQIGLNTQNAIYPYRKSEVVSYTVATGSLSFYKDQIFGDLRLPKFVLVCFQKASQYNGAIVEDCAKFEHCNATSITLSKNNDYRETYTQDFSTSNYCKSYVTSLIRNMGHLDKNLNCGITMADFKNTYPFFTFVLAPDFEVHQTQLPKQGNLRLDIKFASALEKPTSVIVYGIFDHALQINKNRTIII